MTGNEIGLQQQGEQAQRIDSVHLVVWQAAHSFALRIDFLSPEEVAPRDSGARSSSREGVIEGLLIPQKDASDMLSSSKCTLDHGRDYIRCNLRGLWGHVDKMLVELGRSSSVRVQGHYGYRRLHPSIEASGAL